MKIFLFPPLLILSFSSAFCQVKEFGWLLGTWKIVGKNTYEIWTVSPDQHSLQGVSFRVSAADTLWMEDIKIKFERNSFFYIPDVAGDQKAVYFKIKTFNDYSFVAENPAHDFPKIILYRLLQNTSPRQMEAITEGDKKAFTFKFEEVK